MKFLRLLPLAAVTLAQPSLAQHEGHAPAPRATVAEWAKGAQLFDGLGTFHRPITTASPEAQRYFDQGMRLIWAFNHDEATRSFAKAAELDPKCASCFWGVALTLGPNYNMPLMAEPRARAGWEALGKARANAAAAAPVEQALIAALAKRFNGPRPLDPSNSAPLLAAYVTAMEAVARRFPDDMDVQTLLAEGLMNTNPWKLWTADGKPGPGTPAVLAALRKVLAKDPRHPGANHYWIHAVEASADPASAVPSAEALVGMMPAAGHLEHMPAHILQRVGRYEEAAEANRKGAAADVAYLKLTAAPDYYPMYLIHNYQFLAYAAAMEGRRVETVKALRDARAAVPDAMLLGMPGLDWSIGYLYDGMARFGLWDDILAEPAPNPKLAGLTIAWLQARTTALAAKGRVAEAKALLPVLDRAIAAVPADATQGQNPARPLYEIAALKAKARIAMAEGRRDSAFAALREAVKKEDALAYNEPSDEFFPVRHLLGAALLDAKRPAEAEAVYREDLKRNPANGWALNGLARALVAQGKKADAEKARFKEAWENSDTELTASAF
ncbi:MAG TPA: tetratricopeptide repeat protein [Allosphingosinicella sp.]|jgi:tetratricopeptide (TPR) repeat protein